MSIELKHLDDGGVLFRGDGLVDGEEVLRINSQLYKDEEAVRRIRYQLVDLTRVTDYKVDPSQTRRLAKQDSWALEINPSMPIAIVASDELAYGMNRMYQACATHEHEQINLFNNMADAKQWIAEYLKR